MPEAQDWRLLLHNESNTSIQREIFLYSYSSEKSPTHLLQFSVFFFKMNGVNLSWTILLNRLAWIIHLSNISYQFRLFFFIHKLLQADLEMKSWP